MKKLDKIEKKLKKIQDLYDLGEMCQEEYYNEQLLLMAKLTVLESREEKREKRTKERIKLLIARTYVMDKVKKSNEVDAYRNEMLREMYFMNGYCEEDC